MRLITALSTTVDRLALLVESERQLVRLAADGTALETPLTKLLGKVVENLDIVGDIGSVMFRDDRDTTENLAFDNVLSVLVAQLGSRPKINELASGSPTPSRSYSLDDSPAEPLLDHLSFLRHGKDNRERQTLLSRQQAAELLTQRRRKHGNRALHQVHTRCTLAGIAVQGSVGLDEVRYIRDVHSNIVGTILVDLDGYSVIEVLRSRGIDGEDTFSTQVLANLELTVRNATG